MLLCYPLLLDFAPNSVPQFSCSCFLPLLYISASFPLSHHIPTSHLSPACFCPGSFHPCCQVSIFILVCDKTPLSVLECSWSLLPRCWTPETPVVVSWLGSHLLNTQLQILPVESLPHRETF